MKPPRDHSDIDDLLDTALGGEPSPHDVLSGQRVMGRLSAQLAAQRAASRASQDVSTDISHDAFASSGRSARGGAYNTIPYATRAPFPARRWIAFAAACCTLLFAGGIVLSGGYAGLGIRRHGALAMQYRTQMGQRATVTLADGSRVMLAPRSTLSVPSGFGVDGRTVVLDGEAYFDVSHATGAPFVVRMGTAEARVLGTAFSVRRYADDRVARVTVVTGKIALSLARSPSMAITLTAGTVGEASDSSTQRAPAADPAQYTAWTRGRLVFHQTPVTDVLSSMTRWYGYRFRFADSTIVHEVVTVGLSTESSVAAFATLRQILDVDLSFDGDVVTLSSRQRATPRGAAPTRNPRGALISSTHEVGR